MKQKKLQIGVIGSAGPKEYKSWNYPEDLMIKAEKVGNLLAKKGAIVVTGGKSGIMEAAARGAKKAEGETVGVIMGSKRFKSNKFTDIEVLTGMKATGLDELILVLMCDALIVLGGGAGTLQEIAIAYRNNKPVVALNNTGGWSKKLCGQYLDDRKRAKIITAQTPEQAVTKAINMVKI